MYPSSIDHIFDPPTALNAEPELREWPALLSRNANGVAQCNLRAMVQEIRAEMLAEAHRYTNELVEMEPSFARSAQDPAPLQPGRPIVMAGHQPIVYHPGLLYKNWALTWLIKQSGAVGVNVLIDYDDEDAGKFASVTPGKEGPLLTTVSVATAEALIASQKVVSQDEIQALANSVAESLGELGFREAGEGTQRTLDLYKKFAGKSLLAANTVIRRFCEGAPAYLEIPLSHIATLPAVKRFLESILDDYERFHRCYNELLERYRTERRIKNQANPFPNLGFEDGRYEMPLWVVNLASQTRQPLWMRSRESILGREEFLMPRAAMITVILRMLCSDLFVHGLGGGKYDPFTDLLMCEYFRVQPSRFVVASATRYLFSRQVADYEHAKKLLAQSREIAFHPEKYLSDLGLSPNERERVEQLYAHKQELVREIKEKQARRETVGEVTHRVKEIDRKLRECVESALLKRTSGSQNVPQAVLEAYYCRTFPYFFFL